MTHSTLSAPPAALSSRQRPDAFTNFDDFPDTANVSAGVVASLLGVSVPTVWRWAAAKMIPAPRKIGPRVTRWAVGELRRHISMKGAA